MRIELGANVVSRNVWRALPRSAHCTHNGGIDYAIRAYLLDWDEQGNSVVSGPHTV